MTIGHNSAVRGTFADFKTVKTRGVCQLIIEVPIEAADNALALLGGVPQMKAEQWVGIAPVTAPEAPTETERPKARSKRPWNELSMPEQAGILVNDPASAEFIALSLGVVRGTGEPSFYHMEATADDWRREADTALKRECGIESKTELGVDEKGRALNRYARGKFIEIERALRASQHGTTPEAQEQQLNQGPL